MTEENMEPMLGEPPSLVAGEAMVVGDYVAIDRTSGKLVKWKFGMELFGAIRREVGADAHVRPTDFGLDTFRTRRSLI